MMAPGACFCVYAVVFCFFLWDLCGLPPKLFLLTKNHLGKNDLLTAGVGAFPGSDLFCVFLELPGTDFQSLCYCIIMMPR